MAISATWNPDVYGYTLTSGLSGTVSWWRVTNWPDGRVLSVRIGEGSPLIDAMVPISPGGASTYTASNGASSEKSAALTPPATGAPVLNCPGDLTLPAVQVTVLSQREHMVTGRSMFFDVLDRDQPWVEPLRPIQRTGTMEFRLQHPGGAFPNRTLAQVRDLLRTGNPLLLRSPCPERVETLTFVAEQWTESHTGDYNHHGPDRRHTIDWRAAEPIWGEDVDVAKRLWFGVPIEFGTWASVKASGLTWKQLAWGPQ